MKLDLESAGIPDANFHAQRHTFITNMMNSRVRPKTAQPLAKHSTIDLKINVYTTLTLTVTDQAAALNTTAIAHRFRVWVQ